MKNPYQIGDRPVQEEYRQQMNDLARKIDTYFNGNKKGSERTVGFALMVFPFNTTDGRCNYISNSDPKDMLVVLKEQVARIEGRLHEPKGKQ